MTFSVVINAESIQERKQVMPVDKASYSRWQLVDEWGRDGEVHRVCQVCVFRFNNGRTDFMVDGVMPGVKVLEQRLGQGRDGLVAYAASEGGGIAGELLGGRGLYFTPEYVKAAILEQKGRVGVVSVFRLFLDGAIVFPFCRCFVRVVVGIAEYRVFKIIVTCIEGCIDEPPAMTLKTFFDIPDTGVDDVAMRYVNGRMLYLAGHSRRQDTS